MVVPPPPFLFCPLNASMEKSDISLRQLSTVFDEDHGCILASRMEKKPHNPPLLAGFMNLASVMLCGSNPKPSCALSW